MPRNPQPARRLTPGPPPTYPPALDEVDLALVRVLQSDARRSVAALAREVGLAESTCAGRVRALSERGIVRRYVADIDPAAVGLGVEAMVALRLTGHVRDRVDSLRDDLAGVPGVIAIYNTSGADDFLIHVATATTQALRDFVLDHVASRPGVSHTETSLLFEATRGVGPLPR